jgi:hypothetical protein
MFKRKGQCADSSRYPNPKQRPSPAQHLRFITGAARRDVARSRHRYSFA